MLVQAGAFQFVSGEAMLPVENQERAAPVDIVVDQSLSIFLPSQQSTYHP